MTNYVSKEFTSMLLKTSRSYDIGHPVMIWWVWRTYARLKRVQFFLKLKSSKHRWFSAKNRRMKWWWEDFQRGLLCSIMQLVHDVVAADSCFVHDLNTEVYPHMILNVLFLVYAVAMAAEGVVSELPQLCFSMIYEPLGRNIKWQDSWRGEPG